MGGHHVPDDVVRRRYAKGIKNFFSLYQPLATTWRVYDNDLDAAGPQLVAIGSGITEEIVVDEANWRSIKKQAGVT
jgi:predicted ABC-type ATPase